MVSDVHYISCGRNIVQFRLAEASFNWFSKLIVRRNRVSLKRETHWRVLKELAHAGLTDPVLRLVMPGSC